MEAPLLALLCIPPARTELVACPEEALNILGGKYASIIAREVKSLANKAAGSGERPRLFECTGSADRAGLRHLTDHPLFRPELYRS
jgi:hypothetical protein